MASTVTTRIPDELAVEIERIGEVEQLDTGTVVRRLLERAVLEYNRDDAFDQYERGDISLGTLAAKTDLPMRRVLTEMRDRDTHFQYSLESLDEDIPDARDRG